jgi:hypothetical protein
LLAPLDFTMSYLCRSGRVEPARIAATSPRFMAEWARHRTGAPARSDGQRV